MTQFEFEIKIIPSYDKRGETPNYGQHPLVFFFALKGPSGAIVMELNSSWLISEARNWTFPHSEMRRNIQQPYVTEVTLHRHLCKADLHEDPSQMHDDCGWLDGETCIVERVTGPSEAHEWLALFIGEGENGVRARMEKEYRERFPNEQ